MGDKDDRPVRACYALDSTWSFGAVGVQVRQHNGADAGWHLESGAAETILAEIDRRHKVISSTIARQVVVVLAIAIECQYERRGYRIGSHHWERTCKFPVDISYLVERDRPRDAQKHDAANASCHAPQSNGKPACANAVAEYARDIRRGGLDRRGAEDTQRWQNREQIPEITDVNDAVKRERRNGPHEQDPEPWAHS